EKIEHIEALTASGKTVLMVGDGLNDGPALTAAHASLSPTSASDVAQNAADLVFQGEHLRGVSDAVQLSRAARRRMIENFALALGYNAIAVPLAALGFVTPLIAAIAMSSSSLLVTVNALRLRQAAAKFDTRKTTVQEPSEAQQARAA
ncbi:MAG: HAD-IC family P-type ATPase, partial [Pseudomonadota bacterium]